MQNEDGSISPARAFFRNKWVRIVLIIDVIVLLIIIGLAIRNATKTSTINFNITPIDATISINGDTKYTNGQYAMTPGTYKITISHEGLESKTITVDLAPQYSTTVTTFLAGADNNFEFYELKENHESLQKLQEIASVNNNITTDQDISAADFIADFQKAYQLYQNELPISYYEYKETAGSSPKYTTTKDISIMSSDECQKTLCLKAVMFMTDDKNFVENLLSEKGFDLKIFEVIYETPYSKN